MTMWNETQVQGCEDAAVLPREDGPPCAFLTQSRDEGLRLCEALCECGILATLRSDGENYGNGRPEAARDTAVLVARADRDRAGEVLASFEAFVANAWDGDEDDEDEEDDDDEFSPDDSDDLEDEEDEEEDDEDDDKDDAPGE